MATEGCRCRGRSRLIEWVQNRSGVGQPYSFGESVWTQVDHAIYIYILHLPATNGLTGKPAGTVKGVSHKQQSDWRRRGGKVAVASPAAPAAKSLESTRYLQLQAATFIKKGPKCYVFGAF